MKTKLFLFICAIVCLKNYAQTSYEKGYFINNSEQKIECLIKNQDWGINPTHFEYKTSETAESIDIDINSVKEFEIYNYSKYVRETVKIDKSSEDITKVNYERNPLFVEEVLFLKVLIDGNANLYYYENAEYKRFFFNTEKSKIEQLVFKTYRVSANVVAENILFKQQLWSNLKCPTIEIDRVNELKYEKTSLINFFIEYNKCNNKDNSNLDITNYDKKEKKDLFNLNFRLHLNNTSLKIENLASNFNVYNIDFGNKFGLGFGAEAEFILPFNNNKWAIIVEPNYQSFKAEKMKSVEYVSGGTLLAEINYSSIDIPLGLRHYFFINKDSKLFLNAAYIVNVNLNNSISYKKADNSISYSKEIKTRNNFGFGIGYKFEDKYSLEMNYQTSRNILAGYGDLTTKYNILSIIFGYTLF